MGMAYRFLNQEQITILISREHTNMNSHNAAVATNIKTVFAFKPFFLQYFKPRILIRIMAYLTHYGFPSKEIQKSDT